MFRLARSVSSIAHHRRHTRHCPGGKRTQLPQRGSTRSRHRNRTKRDDRWKTEHTDPLSRDCKRSRGMQKLINRVVAPQVRTSHVCTQILGAPVTHSPQRTATKPARQRKAPYLAAGRQVRGAGDSKSLAARATRDCIRRRSVLQTGAMRFDGDADRCVPIVNTGWPRETGARAAWRTRGSLRCRRKLPDTREAPTLS